MLYRATGRMGYSGAMRSSVLRRLKQIPWVQSLLFVTILAILLGLPLLFWVALIRVVAG